MKRTLFEPEHDDFRREFRRWVEKEMVPHADRWWEAGIVDRSLFLSAGRQGYLAMSTPARWGGSGIADFRFNQVMLEEYARAGVYSAGNNLSLHSDVVAPYLEKFADDAQKARWLPGVVAGEKILAVAMTEPGTGSDLAGIATSATREGDHYVVRGSKTFISNGINADLVVTAVRTDPESRHGGLTLLVLEKGMPGFKPGRKLEKIGLRAQDTAELFFDQVRVPVANRLGGEGQGFELLVQNLPQERLAIACSGVALARACLDWTLAYVKERTAFGKTIGSFQNTKFALAEVSTEVAVGETFLDTCVAAHVAGELDAVEAARAKLWCTELQNRVSNACLQLFGGYGYMVEYPIARAFIDSRVATIYGGTSEVMKEIVGRSLGL